MTTKISMIGTNGRINVDRQECQVFLRSPSPALSDYDRGWTVRYTTDLTEEQWFYLRGEEYSAQIDAFVGAITGGESGARDNDFASAAATDRTLALILDAAQNGDSPANSPMPPRKTSERGMGRLLGRFTRGGR